VRRFLTFLIALLVLGPASSLARKHAHKHSRKSGAHRASRRVIRAAPSDTLPLSFFSADTLHQGRATYYRHNPKGGACTLPGSDSLVVAMNGYHYGNAALCGACVEVQGPSGTVVARVVDRCVGCAQGSLDLSRAAFARIAPLSAGRIDVSWRVVTCEQDTVMELHRTANSSKYWSSLQLRGHGVPLRSLEVLVDSAWMPLQRQAHNRYVSRKLPDTPWTIRVTDVWNRTVVDSQLSPAPGRSVSLRVRFPNLASTPGSLSLVR
jgi:expansin (peptidoglycan-binding protein)